MKKETKLTTRRYTGLTQVEEVLGAVRKLEDEYEQLMNDKNGTGKVAADKKLDEALKLLGQVYNDV